MASTSQRSLLVTLLILSIFAISATARPCKTLFISSYSFTLRQIPSSSASSGFVTVFTEIREFQPIHFHLDKDNVDAAQSLSHSQPQQQTDFSSLRDRTKDILSVVIALLFGVGCGALTAATMYFAWSLFAARDYNHEDEDFDDVSSLKKIGYAKIPEASATAV